MERGKEKTECIKASNLSHPCPVCNGMMLTDQPACDLCTAKMDGILAGLSARFGRDPMGLAIKEKRQREEERSTMEIIDANARPKRFERRPMLLPALKSLGEPHPVRPPIKRKYFCPKCDGYGYGYDGGRASCTACGGNGWLNGTGYEETK